MVCIGHRVGGARVVASVGCVWLLMFLVGWGGEGWVAMDGGSRLGCCGGLHCCGCSHARPFCAIDGTGAVVIVGFEMVGETGFAHEAAQTVSMMTLILGRACCG